MLYAFKSKAAGDVIMLGPIGDAVLRIVGKEPSDQGILQASELPDAIAAIRSAIAVAESNPAQTAVESADAESDAVTLRQRAWPLVEMMQAAHASGDAITWGV